MKGEAYNFKTRKDAGRFIGVSLPTLRAWLTHPFFLYRTLIITDTGNGKLEKSKRALLAKVRQDYIEAERKRIEKVHVQGLLYQDRDARNNGSRPKETPKMDGSK